MWSYEHFQMFRAVFTSVSQVWNRLYTSLSFFLLQEVLEIFECRLTCALVFLLNEKGLSKISKVTLINPKYPN